MYRVVVQTIEALGKPIKIPTGDEEGKTKEATIKDVLRALILNFPRQGMNHEDTIHGVRLYTQIEESKDGFLDIETAEYDWVKGTLKKDNVGPAIFGMSLDAVEKALEQVVDKVEAKNAPSD